MVMENSIFKLLMNDDSVNDYTKLYLILYQLNYYKRYYIPNKMICNRLKIRKNWAIRLLKKFEDKGIIKITYIGKKRYFRFNKEVNHYDDFNDFNWLGDE